MSDDHQCPDSTADLRYPDSTATDVTAVRGIQVPAGHDYARNEVWEWCELNDDGRVTSFRLTLQVTVADPSDTVDVEDSDADSD